MSLHFMPGLDLRKMTPQTVLALVVANECYKEEWEDCTVTSVGREGAFLEVGYHGSGNAVDLSVRRLNGNPIDESRMDRIVRNIVTRIGKLKGGQYDIVDERPGHSPSPNSTGAHIHIEYDPK